MGVTLSDILDASNNLRHLAAAMGRWPEAYEVGLTARSMVVIAQGHWRGWTTRARWLWGWC